MIFRLLILAALLAPSVAHSFEWNGARWGVSQGEQVPYLVSENLSNDLTDEDCLEGIDLGYEAWNMLTCSYMRWRFNGRTDNTAWGAGEGQNVTSWREADWGDSSAALAITSAIWGGANSFFTDTDIKFNGVHHEWANFRMAPGRDGRTDIASVSAHEVGHAIGLGHSNVSGSTMWPSTGPGDIGGRSLSADDIAGACDIYPSGGDVPEPEMEPMPVPGSAEFGEDCSEERCAPMLFCLNDGRDLYCSRTCTPGDSSCGEGYYCAHLSGGGGACVRGMDPTMNRAGFGEECGNEVQCDANLGLICINDGGSFYCSGPCGSGCPGGYTCATLQNGDSICVAGDMNEGGPLPGRGDACTDRGLCASGLFCLRDEAYRDEETGELVPYCTDPCEDGVTCEEGFECVELRPAGSACRLVPSAGIRSVGDECWVNPDAPWERPSCGPGLVCTGYEIEEEVVVNRGFCTKNCKPDDCCPAGWGCSELTPSIGQCLPERADDSGFECENADGAGGTEGGAGPTGADSGGGDSGGCTAATTGDAGWTTAIVLLLIGGLRRRRRG